MADSDHCAWCGVKLTANHLAKGFMGFTKFCSEKCYREWKKAKGK
jgi:hypothetical protein